MVESIGEIFEEDVVTGGKYNWEWPVASPEFKVFRLLDGKVIFDENIRDQLLLS